MNLPKYTPGQVAILSHPHAKQNTMVSITIADMFGEVWVYSYEGGSFEEGAVRYVLNGNMWVPAERWNGPTQATDRSQDVRAVLDELNTVPVVYVEPKPSDGHPEFNKALVDGVKRLRIEVKDATEER